MGWNNWHTLGGGLNGRVSSFFVSGTDLYVSGEFNQAGDIPAPSIAKWDGADWSGLGPGALGGVGAVAAVGTGLYAAGYFPSASATNIAKWDRTNWSALGDGVSLLCPGIEGDPYECGRVESLAVLGERLYVGGSFRSAGGFDVNNIAAWDGTNWSPVGSGLRIFDVPNEPNSKNGYVRTLLSRGSELFAGGEFRLAGEVAATNVARWNGMNWFALGAGMEGQGTVRALAAVGADVYAGGFFSSGSQSLQSVAKWDGENWSPLGGGLSVTTPGLGPGPASVQTLAATGTELFVGGIIGTAGGKPSTNIALWHIMPALSASRSGDVLTLSWPATGTNFVLEATDTLPPTDWSEIYEAPVLTGNQLVVTNSISSTARYYRLRRQ